ncbi:hypothetical protein ACFXOR_03970 [Streptomyces sp. NPDC059164]|uniref:hypothetical protein n=1 Tax=unclassified Streptomyces TaxID=2593676 RepID=UPI00368870F7
MSISIPFQRLAQTPFFFALFSLRLGLVERFPAGGPLLGVVVVDQVVGGAAW